MNPKQLRFVEEYLVDRNATQAAIRAGYSEKTAKEQGGRLLTNVPVASAIAERAAKQAKKVALDAETVLFAAMCLALSDIRRAFRDDGTLKPLAEIDDQTAAAIAAIQTEERFEPDGTRVLVRKLKLWSKTPAIELLARHLKLFSGQDGNGEAPREHYDLSRLSGKHLRWLAEIEAVLRGPGLPPPKDDGDKDE